MNHSCVWSYILLFMLHFDGRSSAGGVYRSHVKKEKSVAVSKVHFYFLLRSNWKHPVHAAEHCDLALWPQWTTHFLKTALSGNIKKPRMWMNFTYNCKWEKNPIMLNIGFCAIASCECWSTLHFILSLGMWCSSVKGKRRQRQNVWSTLRTS